MIKVVKKIKSSFEIKDEVMKTYNAMYVENITDVPGEEEVTFPSGSYYMIDKVEELSENQKYYTIHVTIPLDLSS